MSKGEDAVLRLLKRNKVTNILWKNSEIIKKGEKGEQEGDDGRDNQNRMRNMVLILGMTELLYLIACTFSGTSLHFCEAEIQGIEVPAKKQASAKIDELVISQIKEIRLQSDR